jgi:hypothetical protein
LVELYKKALKDANKAKGSYETYFNKESKKATTLGIIHWNFEMANLTVDDYMNLENTIVEYNSTDVFGDLKSDPFISIDF